MRSWVQIVKRSRRSARRVGSFSDEPPRNISGAACVVSSKMTSEHTDATAASFRMTGGACARTATIQVAPVSRAPPTP
jgi:hypothetical protein